FLKDNPDLADEIEKKILEKLGVGVRPEDPAAAQGADTAGGTGLPTAPADHAGLHL
ncbi:DNA recombination/repair protein RecA, partial [Streptomyces sp. NPDC046924]